MSGQPGEGTTMGYNDGLGYEVRLTTGPRHGGARHHAEVVVPAMNVEQAEVMLRQLFKEALPRVKRIDLVETDTQHYRAYSGKRIVGYGSIRK